MAQFNYNEFEKLNAFYDKVLYECIDEVNSIYFVDNSYYEYDEEAYYFFKDEVLKELINTTELDDLN